MKEIILSRGKTALVDDIDYERLSKFRWYARKIPCRDVDLWYAVRHGPRNGSYGKTIFMHKEVLGLSTEIDHKDGDGLHNWRSNLRPATRSQNLQNQRKKSGLTSRYKGVSWNKGKWRAVIHKPKLQIFLGSFHSEIDAAMAYDKAAQQLFGEFARTNF